MPQAFCCFVSTAVEAGKIATEGLCPLPNHPPGFNAFEPKLAFDFEMGQNARSRHGGYLHWFDKVFYRSSAAVKAKAGAVCRRLCGVGTNF
jgi:hypothetical protein